MSEIKENTIPINRSNMPNISYGILAYKLNKHKKEFLMIRRKTSYAFEDFFRGHYDLNSNITNIRCMISRLTTSEAYKILSSSFDILWEDMHRLYALEKYENIKHLPKYKYYVKHYNKHTPKYRDGKDKYNKFMKHPKHYGLCKSFTYWNEPEWCFPKGKKNYNESDFECAIREFKEETYIHSNIDIVNNKCITVKETEENSVTYTNIFYIGKINNKISEPDNEIVLLNNQEVSKIGWFTYKEANNKIRHYHTLIVNTLTQLNKETKYLK